MSAVKKKAKSTARPRSKTSTANGSALKRKPRKPMKGFPDLAAFRARQLPRNGPEVTVADLRALDRY